MADKIHNLREDKNFDEALEQFLKYGPKPKLLRRHLLRRCLVLDWAVSKFENQQRSQCPAVVQKLRSSVAPHLGPLQEQFESRLDLILAASSAEDDVSACRDAVMRCVEATQQAWSYSPSAYVKAAQIEDFHATPDDSRNGPTFLWDLGEGYRALFQDLAMDLGWLHPGLLLAGETLAHLEGVAPSSDHQVRNYVMLTCEAGEQSLGLLAPLTMQGLDRGRGFLIPNVFHAGYLLMEPDFSLGLQNAWQAWRISSGSRPACDVRWSIDIDAAIRRTALESVLRLPLSGRSAEGILACGLRAASSGESLDRNTSISASLALPIERSLALEKVEGIDLKCLAPQFLDNKAHFTERLRRRHVQTVIVSHRQPSEDYNTGGVVEFQPVRSIQEAEEHFHLWPAITREVKASLAKQAGQHRVSLCGPEPQTEEERESAGCSYVQSPVAYLPVRQSERDERAIPLNAEATQQFVLGHWLPPGADTDASVRLRLLADSGMGKSVQLVVCEELIASRSDEMIPIRLGKSGTHRVRLTGTTTIQNIEWGPTDKAVFESLLDNCLVDAYPASMKGRRLDWILRKADNGQLVFLIDALDQTSGDLEKLAKFLKRYLQCPVLAAGRPETPHTRGSLFGQQNWHTLELQPLDRPGQRKLLSSAHASQWVLGDDASEQPYAWTEEQERRKYEVADLLSTPLLLQLLKKILRNTTSEQARPKFRNRFELYQLAAAELLDKGLETSDQRDGLTSGAFQYDAAFQQLALCMHRSQNFSQSLEGDAFERWQAELAETQLQLKDLVQADLITMHGILDRITLFDVSDPVRRLQPGIEWRHLSFQEYFAALELGRLWCGSSTDRQEVSNILRDVHEVMAEGKMRTWPVWDDTTQRFVPQFRDLTKSWRWTLRFLLCSVADAHARDDLALLLVELGNPWIVYHGLVEDHVKLSADVESLARWLVHQDYSREFNFTNAVENAKLGEVVARAQATLSSQRLETDGMLARSTRDASWVSPLRELGVDLNGYYQGTSNESSLLERMHTMHTARSGETWNFLDSFVNVPGGRFDIGRYKDQDDSRKNVEPQGLEIPNLQLADFPVTNELFELFCPTYRRWCGSYSDQADQPAVYVSWYMAQEFCQWLTSFSDNGRIYRPPTEWEWEWACRWLGGDEDQHCHEDYWWGREVNDELCWYGGYVGDGPAKESRRTRSRTESIAAFAQASQRHPSWQGRSCPGLLDLSGNVLEWCANWYDSGESSRSLRGGSWLNDALNCRSSGRNHSDPDSRSLDIGFRLCFE